jgi:hypothetical protein
MDNLHIVNLASYDRPEIVEQKNKEWVNYGIDNDYYSYLIDLFISSTTNNATINGISNMIYGKGLDALDSSTKTEEYAALRSIFPNEDLKRICLDLKLLGEASFQVLYSNKKVVKAEHFPRQTLRAEKMEDGEVRAYYYFHDWAKLKPSDKPKRIPAFGFGNGNEPEIKIIKKYVSGYDYYCPVDYVGGLAYAELEKQIADYLNNDVENGFSGTKVVNFNNGVPDREKQLQIKSDVMGKLTGARGEKVIIAFNNNQESKTTVEDIPLNDAPAHYEYLSNECTKKIMLSHRVTSPLLLGIRSENNGLGSNADEIKTATLLFNNITIKPYQDLIASCIDEILAVNDISLKLYFKTLQPLDFIENKNAITDEAREEETGVKMSDEKPPKVKPEVADALIDLGEDEDLENWELVDEREVDYKQEETLDKMLGLAKVGTGVANPNAKSKQDKVDPDKLIQFKVRYQYAPLKFDGNSRDFCRKMVSAKKIYRKEDIVDMEKRTDINPGWGKNGANKYSIWKFKGGGSCRHFWMRKTYMSTKPGVKADVKNPKAEISVNEAKKEGFKPPVNDKKVAQRPRDMKNRGFIKDKDWTTPKNKSF